jgi:uncharacterized membrane protein YphA (DoxX/SURF4 family)
MSTAATAKQKGAAMPTSTVILSWAARIIAAVILLQTLFFKFTGAAESVYIFTRVGAEPWGRVGSGVIELVAAILLLTPRYAWVGAAIACMTMLGAIVSHLTVLGVEVQGDHGLLFGLAVTVLACSSLVLYLHRLQIPVFGDRLQ